MFILSYYRGNGIYRKRIGWFQSRLHKMRKLFSGTEGKRWSCNVRRFGHCLYLQKLGIDKFILRLKIRIAIKAHFSLTELETSKRIIPS